jgi:hypothetical protein
VESQLWSRVRERDRLDKKFGESRRDGKKLGQWNGIRKKFDEFERALETFAESFDHSFNWCSGGGRCRGACAIISPGLVTRWAPGEARVGRTGEAFAVEVPCCGGENQCQAITANFRAGKFEDRLA